MTTLRGRLVPSSIEVFKGSAFHYTSSVGLIGSLSDGALRASSASSLNDVAEVRQGWDLIRKVLGDMPKSRTVQLLTDLAADPMLSEHEVFVLSASTRGDDANQWRLYADGGRGYALEIDASVALAAVSDYPNPSAASDRSVGNQMRDLASVSPWWKVIYDQASVEIALRELVDSVDGEERQIGSMGAIPQDELDLAFDDLRSSAFEALATIAHIVKEPGFSGENEVRVVTTFVWGSEHVNYRPSSHGVVGYARLAAAPGGARRTVLRPSDDSRLITSVPIRSVRMGPLLRPEQLLTVKSYLRSLGLNMVSVHNSQVPLR